MKRFDVYKRVFPDNGSPFDAERVLTNVSHHQMITYLNEQNQIERCRIGSDVEDIDFYKYSFSVFYPNTEVYYYAVESFFSELSSYFKPLTKHQYN